MNRIAALDYIRAIAMCGVLMIHTGSYAIGNPAINPLFIALFEILTRFSIPVFFFVSAFGLFAGYRADKPFNYYSFLKKRLRAILIPYIIWSALYLIIARDYASLAPLAFIWKLFFGLGSYQLYFLAILIWFYIFMPLWRIIIPWFAKRPILSTLVLFALQAVFNHISVHCLWNIKTGHPLIDALFTYRVNYWIAHYSFIFIFGGICALHKERFAQFCERRFVWLGIFFALAAINITAQYYWYLRYYSYSLLECINTFHQLSRPGEIYTLAATLFLFAALSRVSNARFASVLRYCADASFTVYLVHPLFMYLLAFAYSRAKISYGVISSTLFFLLALLLSLLFSETFNRAIRKIKRYTS